MSLEHPAKDQLIAFGQGKLAADESSSVEQHLEVCRECCETLLDLKDDTFVGLVRLSKTEDAVAEVASIRTDPGADANCVGHDSAHSATLLVQTGEAVSVDELPAELRDHPRYRIVELIGRGGMGNVYRAEHRLMNRPVAIKLINSQLIRQPQAVERFRREVQAAAKLTHPNIVTAYDAEQAGDVHFLVMEFVEGTDLASVVKHRGPMSVAEACDCIRQAAEGLQHAHEKGMVHRDIKPHNLMLSAEGQVRILDFGLAGFVTEAALGSRVRQNAGDSHNAPQSGDSGYDANPTHLTTIGSVMGTPDYIAPEQAKDAHSADIRADIYSLGCTLHFLLTGKPPFEADNVVAKLKAHAHETPLALATLRKDVPSELSKVAARMMAKKPAERFQTPMEVVEALVPFTARTSPRRRRNRQTIIAACLFAALLLVAVIVKVQTDNGELVIEATDDVAVLIEKAGVKIRDTVTGREYSLKPGKQPLRSGEYEIDVTELPSGITLSTRKFTLIRGGATKVVATLTQPASKAPTEPVAKPEGSNKFVRDQQAADWVLRVGGKIRIDVEGVNRQIDKAADLPTGDWQISNVDLWPVQLGPKVKLDKLAGLQSLRWLRLFGTQISDEGLSHLTDVPKLTLLDLDHNYATTDAALKHIGEHLQSLTNLGLDRTSITDDGLAFLATLKDMRGLNLTATKLTGSGLSHLATLTSMDEMLLNETTVTDQNLKHLALIPNLQILGLFRTSITDAAVPHLARLEKLKRLDIRETKISLAGLEKLQAALPNTSIAALTAEQQQEQWNRSVESVAWTPLEPTTLTANGGTTLRQLDDRSLLAEGPNPAQSIYTVVAKTSLKRVSSLRLDVIRDDSLPSKGPGRHTNGTFVLTGIELRFAPAPGSAAQDVAVRRSFADYSQVGHDVSQITTAGKGVWAIHRGDSPMQNQSLILDLATPLTLHEGSTISVALRHESVWQGANVGRFRLSATDADRAPADKSPAQANVPAARTGVNLIHDPSLETTALKLLPPGWSAWLNEGPDSRCELVEGGHTGKRSLQIIAKGTRAVVFANSVPLDRSKRYAVKGWAKFEGDKDARAIIKFNYFHNGKWLGVHDLVGVTADQPGWHLLEKTDAAEAYPEATLLVPTCHVEGNGSGWFDDLELIAYDRDKLPANFEAAHGKNNRLVAPLDFDRWVGEWDATFDVKPNAQSAQDRNTRGTMTTRKVLDDRFLLTHSENESDPTQWLWFLTHDANLSAYRIWIFGSGGEAFERRGQWDAASQMLTLQLVPPSPGVTGQSTDRFIGNDHIESTLFVKSAEGQVTRDNRWSAKKKTPQPKSLAEVPTVAAPVALPEELSLLNKFAGDWTIRAKSKPSIWLPNGGEETQIEKVAWILGGRFLMARTFNEKDQLTSIWLATYEPSEKSNRFWFFNADGSSGQWRVTWDAASRGFHWRSIDMPTGWIGTGFNRWINDDTFDNQALIKDENGRVLLDGMQDKRRKK